ncbi:hypothetical protein ACVOMT_11205 [Sphingomonas panni]
MTDVARGFFQDGVRTIHFRVEDDRADGATADCRLRCQRLLASGPVVGYGASNGGTESVTV